MYQYKRPILEKKGKFKHDQFVVFEAIRKNKEKGGSLLIVHEEIKPELIKEYNEIFEIIVIEVNSENNPI